MEDSEQLIIITTWILTSGRKLKVPTDFCFWQIGLHILYKTSALFYMKFFWVHGLTIWCSSLDRKSTRPKPTGRFPQVPWKRSKVLDFWASLLAYQWTITTAQRAVSQDVCNNVRINSGIRLNSATWNWAGHIDKQWHSLETCYLALVLFKGGYHTSLTMRYIYAPNVTSAWSSRGKDPHSFPILPWKVACLQNKLWLWAVQCVRKYYHLQSKSI